MRKIITLLTSIFLIIICSTNCRDNSKQVSQPEVVVISSNYLGCDDTCLVFTPAKQTVFAQTPTLFLLHGWSGCYRDWSNKYDIQEISDRTGFRIICPDGFYNSWYVNSSNPEGMQWRKFWDSDLWPTMKEKYGLVPEYTFITGLSMGGHGAINIFMDHPENFRSAGSMSGVLDINMTTLIDSWVSKVLGDYMTTDEKGKKSVKNKRYDEESAIYRLDTYAKTHPFSGEKVLMISSGYEDIYSACAENFSKKCKELGVPHVLHLSKATHSWKYWGYALEEHISHFTKILNGENLGF